MKVLLISPLPPPAGGIASWTNRYLNSTKACENEIDVVNISVTGKRANNFTSKKNFVQELKRLFDIVINLRKKLKANKYDIVHLNSSCSKSGLIRDWILSKIVKNNNTKLVVHMHCDVSFMIKNNKSLKLLKRIVEVSDNVLVLNSSSRDFILKNCNVNPTIVPNFVSDKYISALSIEHDIKPKVEKILYVGHVTKQKGCDLILDIAPSFPDKTFVLLGVVSSDLRNIQRPENVIFKGEVALEEVIEEYKTADVFLFPTHTEGFPTVVLEAMAIGLPIVSTCVGAIGDMLEDKGGIYIPVNDKCQTIEAIKQIENADIRKVMSVFNQQKVEKYYTVDNVMNKLFEIYEKVL